MELKISYHAKVRGLERLAGREEGEFSDDDLNRMEILLKSLVKVSTINFVDGSKYLTRVEGFDNVRAVISVTNGVHTLLTITPII